VKALFDKAFDEEDQPTIEAAYRNIDGGEFWEQKPIFLGVDAGGLRARRLLERFVSPRAILWKKGRQEKSAVISGQYSSQRT
jgi:hypothetical protein